MGLPDRNLLIGMTLGAFCATALAFTGPGYVAEAFASEAQIGIDPDALVRIDDEMFDISYEDWVATDPISNATVRKIGYGSVETVQIATTATGTYSSDGLASPYVSYPGIEVERVGGVGAGGVLVYGGFGTWIAAPLSNSSIQRLNLGDGGRLVTFGNTACSISRSFVVC